MRWLVLLAVLGCVLPADAARYRGRIALAGATRPARTHVQGDRDLSAFSIRLDASFRCAGRGCFARRGFLEVFCLAGGSAVGHLSDRRTLRRCEFTGRCPGATIVGTFVCPGGPRGDVSLQFVRP